MKQALAIDVMALKPKKRGQPFRERKPAGELESFFDERGIPKIRLAEVLSVSPTTVGAWFRDGIPVHREKQLLEIVEKIRAWEADRGKKFPG